MEAAIGVRFKRLREVLGLTQRKAGDLFGVEAETYARWERGALNPGGPARALLERLEAEHDVTPERA